MIKLYKGDAGVVVQALSLMREFRGDPNSGVAYEAIRNWTPAGISVDRDKLSIEQTGVLVLARINGIIAAIAEQSEDGDR